MSQEAKEFLDENGHDLHKDSLYVMDEELGEVFPINVDIPNLLDEYFAFRLGKMIFDGSVKVCDGGDTFIIGESQQFSKVEIELGESGSKSVLIENKRCDNGS